MPALPSIAITIKLQEQEPPSWRINDAPRSVANDIIDLLEGRPLQDEVHYETHVLLPASIKRALNGTSRLHPAKWKERLLEQHPALHRLFQSLGRPVRTPEQMAEAWTSQNRIYVTGKGVTFRFDNGRQRRQGAIYMPHIMYASLESDDRLVIHTRNNNLILPPLCRPAQLAAAVNRILRNRSEPPLLPACQSCRHYRRRLLPGNRGDCVLQPELSVCCPLDGHHDRCQRFEDLARPVAAPEPSRKT